MPENWIRGMEHTIGYEDPGSLDFVEAACDRIIRSQAQASKLAGPQCPRLGAKEALKP